MSVSQWLLPLAFMGLISCQVGVESPSLQPILPIPSSSATTTVISQDSIPDYPSYLSGKIFDNAGNPIANASITIRSLDVIPAINPDGPFEYTKQANENGEYSIPYPAVLQAFWVIASKSGYLTVERKIVPDKNNHSNFFDFGVSQGNSTTALKRISAK